MTTQGLFYLPRDRPLEADVAIDLSDCPGTAELLQDLGSALAFPDWYGANFDALFDCLSDPDIPGCIRLFGLDAYAHRHPDDFAILVEVLRASCAARAEMEVPLTVCIDTTASGVTPWPGA